MRILLIILIFSFLNTNSIAKIIDVGLHKIYLKNDFFLTNWNDLDFDFLQDVCQGANVCYLISSSKVKEVIDELQSGKDYEQIDVLEPIISKINKLTLSDYNNAGKNLQRLFSTTKDILKKYKSGTIYDYYIMGSTDDYLGQLGLNFSVNELRNMSNEELKIFKREIKKELNISKNYFPITEEMGISIKKFDLKRSKLNNLYLHFSGEIIYYYDKKYKLGKVNFYISEIDGKLFIFDGYCLVNCNNFNSEFKKITEKSFQQVSTKSVTSSIDQDIVEKLRQLNEFYKSGVLTKEEFEKAKKRLLN